MNRKKLIIRNFFFFFKSGLFDKPEKLIRTNILIKLLCPDYRAFTEYNINKFSFHSINYECQ